MDADLYGEDAWPEDAEDPYRPDDCHDDELAYLYLVSSDVWPYAWTLGDLSRLELGMRITDFFEDLPQELER